ncbi:hypothetical protein [Micromonospora sp. NPDC003776]
MSIPAVATTSIQLERFTTLGRLIACPATQVAVEPIPRPAPWRSQRQTEASFATRSKIHHPDYPFEVA